MSGSGGRELEQGAGELAELLGVDGVVMAAEVHVLNRPEEERQGRPDQHRRHEPAAAPVAAAVDERLPFVRDPRRRHGLGRHHQDELGGLIDARRELRHPTRTGGDVDAVEEDRTRLAVKVERRFEVGVQGLDPIAVARGVAEKGGVRKGAHGLCWPLVKNALQAPLA